MVDSSAIIQGIHIRGPHHQAEMNNLKLPMITAYTLLVMILVVILRHCYAILSSLRYFNMLTKESPYSYLSHAKTPPYACWIRSQYITPFASGESPTILYQLYTVRNAFSSCRRWRGSFLRGQWYPQRDHRLYNSSPDTWDHV